MASTPMKNQEFWTEFIDMYKGEPALWKVKSECYKDRNLKAAGYNKLITKLKEIEPNADRDMVRKKVNVLRTNYRRELKKIKDSEKIAASPEDVYVPSLWYFEDIDFLRDLESTEEEIITKQEYISPAENPPQNNPTQRERRVEQSSRKRRRDEDEQRRELLAMTSSHLSNSNDEFETLGRIWLFELQKCKPYQQLWAKKAINDVLVEARLGTLHRHSVKINEPPYPPSPDITIYTDTSNSADYNEHPE